MLAINMQRCNLCLHKFPIAVRHALHHPSTLLSARARLGGCARTLTNTVQRAKWRPSKGNIWLLLRKSRTTSLLVLGCGVFGSYLALRTIRSSHCLAPLESVPTNCQTTSTKEYSQQSPFTNQLSLLQRIYISFRLIYLLLLFSPTLFIQAAVYLTGSTRLEKLEVRYLIFVLHKAGPAFIKLGQWASTRRDLFSETFCQVLSSIHTQCNLHTWAETKELLTESFGEGWEERLVIQDSNPIGSGCVAQVYQGYLKPSSKETKNGLSQESVPIAVKVLHPRIVEAMDLDIRLMKSAAFIMDYLHPDLYWIALKDCVNEFALTMENQLDMEIEARNLSKFNSLMQGYDNVKFPTPLYPFVTKTVLVESYERGEHISEYLSEPGGLLQKRLAKIGVDVLLDMMFVHNFVHGDLHPGNILVQDPTSHPTLVLIDCGIATSLGPVDFEKFHKVFKAIVMGDGETVADLILDGNTCLTHNQYRRDMADLVNEYLKSNLKLTEIQVGTLFSRLFNVLIDHKVRIAPNYTSVMVALIVIEGVARSLDPAIDVLEYARHCILQRAKLVFQDKLKQSSKSFFQKLFTYIRV